MPECIAEKDALSSDDVNDQILLLAHAVPGEGFEDFGLKDIDELLAEHTLNDEELLEMIEEHDTDNDPDDITKHVLENILQIAGKLETENDLQYSMARYKQLYQQFDGSYTTADVVGLRKRVRTISDDSE